MKKLITFAATVSMLALLGLSSVTASADSPCATNPSGTTTCTMNLHGQTFPIGPAPACIVDATGFATNVNSVMHFTINGAGDFWGTGTIEGDVNLTSAGTTYTGHFMVWFGGAENKNNFVGNETFNAHLTAPDGSTLDAHLSAGGGVSASGQPIMHLNIFC